MRHLHPARCQSHIRGNQDSEAIIAQTGNLIPGTIPGQLGWDSEQSSYLVEDVLALCRRGGLDDL